MRILYWCPAANAPIGGIKVIYRHVEILNSIGVESYVLHPKKNFKCDWFQSHAPIYQGKYLCKTDHLILPEGDMLLDLSDSLIKSGIRYSIFCQNAYNIPSRSDDQSMQVITNIWQNAHSILCISDDTINVVKTFFPELQNKILKVQLSIHNLFSEGQNKQNIITYMPRKNPDHVQKVIFGLKLLLPPNWKLLSIDKMTEQEVAQTLQQSKIFLSFSEFEGFGLPPLEAALTGNIVIGYHGNGGKEYWETPLFHEVYPYDIASYIGKTIELVNKLDSINHITTYHEEKIYNLKTSLVDKYSLCNETNYLIEMFNFVKNVPLPVHFNSNIKFQFNKLEIKLMKTKKSIKKLFNS